MSLDASVNGSSGSYSITVSEAAVYKSVPPIEIVYALTIERRSDDARVRSVSFRTHSSVVSFHQSLAMMPLTVPLPPIPSVSINFRPNIGAVRADMQFYMQQLVGIEEIHSHLIHFLEEAKVSELVHPIMEPDYNGFAYIQQNGSWHRRYFILKGSLLHVFASRVTVLSPNTNADKVISLQHVTIDHTSTATLNDESNKKPIQLFIFDITSEDAIFHLATSCLKERTAWLEALRRNATLPRPATLANLTPETRKAINEMKKLAFGEDESRYPIDPEVEKTILRFLGHHSNDLSRASNAYIADLLWREQLDIKNLTISSVHHWLKMQKLFTPGGFDREGRPIIIFRAKHHDPNVDFFEQLKLAVYNIERTIEIMTDRSPEITLLEDLDGFSRDKADPRMAKLMLEMVVAHYPGRLGIFVAFNAPWYYRLLFKIVRPCLSADLVAKVHIVGSSGELDQFVDKSQLLPEWGGTLNFNMDQYIEERCQIENVKIGEDRHRPHEELLTTFRDTPVDVAAQNCIRFGWMMKEGGYVKQFNKRYCVLRDTILYYYKGKSDAKAEGFFSLRGAKLIERSGNVFVLSSSLKDAVFQCETSKDKLAWMDDIKLAIRKLSADNGAFGLRSSSCDSMFGSSTSLNANLSPETISCSTMQVSWSMETEGIVMSQIEQLQRSSDTFTDANEITRLEELAWNFQNDASFTVPFRGGALISWLTGSNHTKEQAVATANALLRAGIITTFSHHVCVSSPQLAPMHQSSASVPSSSSSVVLSDLTEYSFQERVTSTILNLRKAWLLPARSAQEVADGLWLRLSGIVKEFTKNHQKPLSLRKVRRCKALRDFTLATAELQLVDVASLSLELRAAFFARIYHILSVHFFLMVGEPVNYISRWNYSAASRYRIGPFVLSLLDIEHGILRANSAIPGSNYAHHFTEGDDRVSLALPNFDNRIHFLLNPGVFLDSVTEIDWLDWNNFNDALARATTEFLNADVEVNASKRTVYISSMFNWYRNDFGGSDESVLRFIASNLNDTTKSSAIETMLAAKDFTLYYKRYRWPRTGQLFSSE